MDRDIEKAIKSGERNRDVMQLVYSWCLHARVQKTGGTGIIEAQTGLPIGHHAMVCDYAPASGIATWDLAHSAIDFYDRNCVNCQQRVPRGLPNISILIRERDESKRLAANREAKIQEENARALALRRSRREELKRVLPFESSTIVEQLEDLDCNHSSAAEETLIQTARLAPDIFVSDIQKYLFELIEANEWWCLKSALNILHELKADPQRLTRCAMSILRRPTSAAYEAANVVTSNIQHVDAGLVPASVSTLTWIARPPRLPFGDREFTNGVSEPLQALYKAFPDAVTKGIHELLNQRNPAEVRDGASAIIVIHDIDQEVDVHFVRSVVALLVRGETVLDLDDQFGRNDSMDLVSDLQHVLGLSLEFHPHAADEIVTKFFDESNADGHERIVRTYADLFWPHGGELVEKEAHTVALKRLLEISLATDEFKVLMGVLAVFRHESPDGLEELVRRETAHLLGVIALLDARRRSFDEARRAANSPLQAMELNNLISIVSQLQEGIAKWCASAAVGNDPATKMYLEVLRGLPESEIEVRSILVTALSNFTSTVDGLRAILPELYSSLVGPSSLIRAAAVGIFENIDRKRREDLPWLLQETFALSLGDPFVIVHKSAVRALDHGDVPESLRPRAKAMVKELILAYAHANEDRNNEFLMTCIALYVYRYATPQELKSDFGALLVEKMNSMSPFIVTQRLGQIHTKLADAPGFAPLCIKLLGDSITDTPEEKVVRALRSLRPELLHQHRALLQSAALEGKGNRLLAPIVVELLTAANAWDEAYKVACTALDSMADTVRNKPTRLQLKLLHIATEYEKALAEKNRKVVIDLEREWEVTQEAIETDRTENEKRRRFFPGLPD